MFLSGANFIDWIIDVSEFQPLLAFFLFQEGIVSIVRIYLHFCYFEHIYMILSISICALGLWYIDICRIFNAKSIFNKWTVLFQTIQFSISLIVKNISISSYSV